MNEPESNALLCNVTWAVSNLCRGKPAPKQELIQTAVVPLATMMDRNVPGESKIDALWALSYLSDGDDSRIQLVIDSGVYHKLIELAKSNNLEHPLTIPLVRTLGNCVTGSDKQTQMLVDAGVINAVEGLLDHAAVSEVL
jgi:importin subunit alpha-6/7